MIGMYHRIGTVNKFMEQVNEWQFLHIKYQRGGFY